MEWWYKRHADKILLHAPEGRENAWKLLLKIPCPCGLQYMGRDGETVRIPPADWFDRILQRASGGLHPDTIENIHANIEATNQ